ncbi:MAG: PKD-like family lipoprotein [Odoribacter splanchnicus]
MRTIYLFFLALLPIWCWSCYDDKGNYDYHELNQTEVTGIEPVYRRDLLSRLSVNPVIQSEDKNRTYDYVWMTFKESGAKKIDTLSKARELDWLVSADPGIYKLVFEYRDKQNGVVNYIESQLTVESEYFRGWYVMKQKGETTDIDFFSPELQNSGLIQKSRGEALAGKPRSLSFLEDYAYIDEEQGVLEKNNACVIVVSGKELQMVRISDLKMVGDFHSLFYEQQGVVAPGKWFGGSEEHGLVNDGKVFTIDVHGAPLGAAKFAYAKVGDYELAHLMTKNGTMSPLFFDTKSCKFCTVARNNPNLIYLKSDESSKFPEVYPDQEPIYAGFLDEGMWEGGKGYVVMQKKDATHARSILHFDLNCLVYFDPDFLKNRITAIDDIPLESELAQAECFGMNRTYQMLYFSKGDKLWYYDLQNKREQEVKRTSGQPAIPAGEKIVMIKHIIFDDSYSAPDDYTNKLVIATGNGNTYKLYLFETMADKVKDNPEIYQGEGVPSEVMFMSSAMGAICLCY